MRQFNVSRVLCAALVALGLAAGTAWAQGTGTIRGTVTDQAGAAPLQGAVVLVVGTNRAASTNAEGRFSISGVPAGNFDVRAILVGFESKRLPVTVVAGEAAELNFSLKAAPFQLEEIVSTATGDQRKLELGNAVSVIKADQVAQMEPVLSLSNLLSGRASSVQVTTSSGTTGAGTRIRIRGSNSVSLSNDPLLYIDGVRAGSGTGFSVGTGGQSISRLNDLNPEDIESIEIVKGPSAATLYGTEAANGVIRVTTKRGSAGRAKWNFYVEQGTISDPNTYPDNYRGYGTNTAGATVTCNLVDNVAGLCTRDSVATFNVLENSATSPIGSGNRQQYGLSVTGGSDLAQYFVAGEFESETGTFELPALEEQRLLTSRGVSELPDNVLRPNYLRKVNLRANLNAQVLPNADVQISTGYVSSNTRLPQNDNNVLGMLPSGYFGRVDTTGNGGWGFFRPGEIFSLLRQQDIERFTGSLQGNWRPLSFFSTRVAFGYDINNRTDLALDPTGQAPAFSTFPLGNKTDNRFQLKTYTVDWSASANVRATSTLNSRSTVGLQYFKDVAFSNGATGSRLVFGQDDIDGAQILTATESKSTSVTLGGFVEQQIAYKDRLFLTAAIRVDDNSSFGKDFDAIVFPKASVSYLVSDEPYWPQIGFLNTLRLRGSYGASGLQPGVLDAVQFFTSTAVSGDNATLNGITFGALGNANLKPEKSKELEVGFDATLFSDRVGLEFTFYDKVTSDALINRVLPPSAGVSTSRLENLGSVRNSGFEVSLNARPIDSPDFGLDFTITASKNRNNLRTLGEGIPPIVEGDRRFVPNYPLGGFWARPYTFDDANGDGVIVLSELTVGDTAVFAGSPFPTRELSLNTGVTLFKNKVRLGAQADYRGGHKQLNLTEVFRCTATGNNCQGLMDPNASLEDQARVVARRFHPSATNFGFFEDAWFIKLREVSLTFNAPDAWAAAFRASRMSITLAGRNLGTITDYRGVDPEVLETTGSNFGTRDFLTQPQVRTLLARVNLSF